MNQKIIMHPDRPIHRAVLKNGLVVLAVENATADIVAARIFIKAGSVREPQDQAGLAHLVSAVMTKGTDQWSSLEIAEQVESVGAGLSTDAASDYFLMSLKSVSADFPELLALAGHILRSPSFPEAEVELERRLTLQAIRSQKEQPFSVAMEQLRRAMYQDHPYAWAGLGSESTVSQLGRAELHQFHQTYFRPDNIIISLVGRIDPEAAIATIQDIFGDWANPSEPLPDWQLPVLSAHPYPVTTLQDTQQAIVMLGYLAPSVSPILPGPSAPSDYAALKLLNTYLGNGLSSRLFVELREKRGLAYEVSAFYPTRFGVSQFAVYMGTAPENTAIACEGLQREVDRLCITPLTESELQMSKNKLLGQYALGKQTNAQIAQVLGWYEALGLGVDFDQQFPTEIAAITAETAQAAAQKYFSTPYLSLVGPESAVNLLASPAIL